MTRRLQGKTALITGGSSGIGLATARLFLEHGARVAITGRDPQTLAAAVAALGHDVDGFVSDAGNTADIARLMDDVKQRYGRLDVLFANAAIAPQRPFEHITEADFDAQVAVDFKGPFFAVQHALPLLAPNASVILTTSIANQSGAPNATVYGACKAALRSLAQSLAVALSGRGIRVNAVSPGPIETPLWGKFGLPDAALQAARQAIASRSPSGRFGKAEEIARAVLFLASDESSYVVGQELVVDGGMVVL